jgi:hypothetical protein
MGRLPIRGAKAWITLAVAFALVGPVAGLHRALPSPLPARTILAGWEHIEGEVTQKDGVSYDYEMYVDPERSGMYAITHYQVLHPATATLPALRESEKVVWSESAGQRVPLRLFERIDGRWRTMSPTVPAYTREMLIVMHLYGLHRQAGER